MPIELVQYTISVHCPLSSARNIYLNFSTLFLDIASNVVLEFSNKLRFVEITGFFVFLVLMFKPIDLLLPLTKLTSSCRSCIFLAIKSISSAYRLLLNPIPLTLIPLLRFLRPLWKLFLNINSIKWHHISLSYSSPYLYRFWYIII